MKAIFCSINESFEMELEEVVGTPGKNIGLIVSGYVEDKTMKEGWESWYGVKDWIIFLIGSMWNGNGLCYETYEVYELCSQ